MEIGNETEGTMSEITTPRYGYSPGIAFSATRAFAQRRALETATAAVVVAPTTRSVHHVIRRLAGRLRNQL